MDNSKSYKEGIISKKPEYKAYLDFYLKQDLDVFNAKHFLFWSDDDSEKEFLEYLESLSTKNKRLFHSFVVGATTEGKGVYHENLIESIYENSDDSVIIDCTGVNYEGCWWSKKYKCYFVYPRLLKSVKKADNPNVIEIKLNAKNTWENIIIRAKKYKRIIVLMVSDVLESTTLKALRELFKALTTENESLDKVHKMLLFRELSFLAYKHGMLKLSDSELLKDLKRYFLKLIRTGRHSNNQIFADAQNFDIDKIVRDNVALIGYKRLDDVPVNIPNYVSDVIKKLKKHHVVFNFKGSYFTGTIRYNDFHKKEIDNIRDLGIFPKKIELNRYNKVVESRYINYVCEYYTNVLGKVILGRRKHLKNPDNSKLTIFEIADIVALDGKFLMFDKDLLIRNFKLIYIEVKYRNAESKTKKVQLSDVRKTIQDLHVKKIRYDINSGKYFWDLDIDVLKKLNIDASVSENIPVDVRIITTNGYSKGAKTLMNKHKIKSQIIKVDKKTFIM